MADDDGDPPRESTAIRMADFSPEVEVLYVIADRLADVTSAVVGSAGGKPKRIKPLKRPQTAYDRVAHRKQEARHQSLVSRVLPTSPKQLPG